MAFMIESRWVFAPTDYALKTSALDEDYDQAWDGFPKGRVRLSLSDSSNEQVVDCTRKLDPRAVHPLGSANIMTREIILRWTCCRSPLPDKLG